MNFKNKVALKLRNSLITPLYKSTVYVLYCTLCIFQARSEYFIYVSCHSDSVVPPNEGERFFKSVDIVQSRPRNLKFVHISSISLEFVNRRVCFLHRKQFAFEENKRNKIYTLAPSMSFYPDFILILSWFYLDFILILSKFYPDKIRIKFG